MSGNDVSTTARQRTLKTAIACNGIGLHSGAKLTMTLHPAEPDTGILFRRTDISGGGAEIPARFDHVVDTRMCTVVGSSEGATVGTIEHLMSALAGMGIDNAVIEINGAEVPVMDGSAAPFVFLIECAGMVEQNAPRRAVKVLRPVTVHEGDKAATLAPAEGGLTIDFSIDFAAAAISHQDTTVGLTPATFKADVSRARTFGLLEEVAYLQANGLAKGGSLENAVVVSGDKILNEDGLRYEDEFVRHKVLDAVGDLYTAGAPIIGHYTGVKAGHALTNQLLRALFADDANWTWVDAPRHAMPVAPAPEWAAAAVG